MCIPYKLCCIFSDGHSSTLELVSKSGYFCSASNIYFVSACVQQFLSFVRANLLRLQNEIRKIKIVSNSKNGAIDEYLKFEWSMLYRYSATYIASLYRHHSDYSDE